MLILKEIMSAIISIPAISTPETDTTFYALDGDTLITKSEYWRSLCHCLCHSDHRIQLTDSAAI